MDFWHFAGSYWWLVFPLVGAVGGAVRAWEKGARRRHERRLETLRLKGELRAARRGVVLASASLPAAESTLTTPVPTQTAAQTERLFEAQDAVTARWLEYELDVAKVIAYPAMSDGRQPLVAAFLRAKKVADSLRPAPTDEVTPAHLADYREAVTDYEVAFDLAERDARRLSDSSFSVDERKRLDTAKKLLATAVDEAATPAERQLAYRRVRDELDGLLSLSDGAIDRLEKRVALELPRGNAEGSQPGI